MLAIIPDDVPSAFTHAVAAASIGSVVIPGRRKLIALGAVCSVVPDADVIGFRVGIPYEHMLGHRGLSHSVAFAAVLAVFATWIAVRNRRDDLPVRRAGLFLFLASVSHGLLDAMTNGGLGIAFFAPFSPERYFFPWRPIVVSPISIRRFMTGRGVAVVTSEFLFVWIPATLVWTAGMAARRRWAHRDRPGSR